MQSKAKTVKQYLAALPADRREAIEALRKVILDNLADGYEEGMQYGAIGYYVPHSVYPPGYHCDTSQPLPFVGLASQKNHLAIHMFCLYCDPNSVERFQEAWAKEHAKGKAGKLDMGKSCVRVKKIEDVPLSVIGKTIKRMPVKKFVSFYEGSFGPSAELSKTTKKTASKKTKKKTTKKASTKKSSSRVTKKTAAKKAAGKKAARRKRVA